MTSAPAWARHLPAGRDWEALDLLAGGSIPAVVARWGEVQPLRPAFGAVTWRELLGRSELAAGRLAGMGLSLIHI